MSLRVLLLQLLLLISAILSAQPDQCMDENPDMTPTCIEACIICDIDGFTGRHDSDVSGSAPSDFCTLLVHNAQWIAFIAGSTELTVNIAVSNCDLGVGLEIAIYEAINCENFNLVSNCFGAMSSIGPGESGNVVTNEPLTIGQYYYIVMDGAMADNCDWTLTVVEGNTQVLPLTNSGNIEGDFTVCPEITTDYFTEAVSGASDYEWTLNGSTIPSNGLEVAIEWETEGTYQLCVQASNACDEAEPSCQNITVESIPAQTINAVICDDETFILDENTELTEAGEYEFNYLSFEGCDSTIFVNLDIFETSLTEFDINICDGDTIFIGNIPFTVEGEYLETLDNYLGCDSLVSLDLGVIICLIQGTTNPTPVVCNGEASGMIDFFITDGTPPFTYTYSNLEETIQGNGNITAINETINISNLPFGTYLINVFDNFGNETILIEYITEPSVFDYDWALSDYSGFNVSCFEGADGAIEIIPMGGVGPYFYNWGNGSQNNTIENQEAGTYQVTITDTYGCQLETENSLTEPTELTFSTDFTNASCEGLNSGMIEINSISGGISPYQYALDAGDFIETGSFENLPEGTYTITVQDNNGCETDTMGFIIAPIIPVIDLGEDIDLFLGDEIQLNVNSNIELDTSIIWSPIENLSCSNCPNPTANPYHTTTYFLTVTSIDDCSVIDSLTINVLPRRRVYVPNAFSPNDDGVNDVLTIFGGEEVEIISSFSVYSRWGELIYQENDIPPNSLNRGWDGKFRGQESDLSTFVWVADVLFLDGEVGQYSGDVLLLK